MSSVSDGSNLKKKKESFSASLKAITLMADTPKNKLTNATKHTKF